MIEILNSFGAFIDSPPKGAVIAFCWAFSWLITFAIIQKFKRLFNAEGKKPSALCLEGAALYISFGVSMLIMVGLYSIDFRSASIHSILIAGAYNTIVSVGMTWMKEKNPEMYQAIRTNRRMDDTQEFKGGFDGR